MPEIKRNWASRLGCLVAVAWCVTQWGCQYGGVERRLIIRSNPPGARVYVDDYEVGTTPVGVDFLYYGTREIRLVKDGFETLTVLQPVPAPWYQIPPLDFFSENLTTQKIRDVRVVDFQLVPQVIVPTEQLLDRAENLRRNSQPPAGVTLPPTTAPILPGAIPSPGAPGSLAPPNY